jgi:FkbM family methyltransferase
MLLHTAALSNAHRRTMANLIHLAKPFHTVLFQSRLLRGFSAFLLKSLVPGKVRVGGAVVCPNPSDPVISAALALGLYEREETDFFRKTFRQGMSFVDVGANVGLFTALAIAQGASRVLALEPHRESLAFLEKTVRANNPSMPVFLECKAAGPEAGECGLYGNPYNKGDNRTAASPELVPCGSAVVSTLDTLCAAHGIGRIDFLKIDVQGGELGVLHGASGVLADSPGCILVSEVWPGGMARCGHTVAEFMDCLRAMGFEIERVFGRKDKRIPEPSVNFSDYTNLVAIKGDPKIG